MPLVALGVSSSIAVYKACEVLRGFQKAGIDVQPILTPHAAELISPLLFSSLSGRKAIVGLFEAEQDWSVAHVALAKAADMLIVAPATANVIAKLANGLADDFLSTFALALEKPILVAPAMNTAMLKHPQTRENMRRLRERGVEFIEAGSGYLACGDEGQGRLAEPEAIVAKALEILGRGRSLAGRTVLVTAGPTREFLDPIRYLSNRSSGKMGYAAAAEAVRRGAKVVLVSGPTALEPPAGTELVRVVSAAEMAEAVLSRIDRADILVMAAAVADITFAAPAGKKIKKGDLPAALPVAPAPDILKAAAERARRPFLVGFAAETEDVVGYARRKLADKKLDLIAANDVSAEGLGFDSDFNQLTLLDAAGGEVCTPVAGKAELARLLWDAIETHVSKKRQTRP